MRGGGREEKDAKTRGGLKDKRHSADLFRMMKEIFQEGPFAKDDTFPMRGFCPALPTHRSPPQRAAYFLLTGAVHLLDISENISKGLAVRHP